MLLLLVLWVMRWGLLAVTRSQLQGSVVDEQTGKPLEGAVVVAHQWSARLLGGKYRRAQIAEGLTDSAGRFHLVLESSSLQYVWLTGPRDVIVVARDYAPFVVPPGGGGDDAESLDRSGHLVVQLKPLGRPATPADLEVVTHRVGEIYRYLPVVCREVEVPMLLQQLRDAQAYPARGAIDKRNWDDRRDCVR